MKKIRIISAALSCIAAAVITAVQAFAVLDTVDESNTGFSSSSDRWTCAIGNDNSDVINKGAMLEFVVSLKGDAEKYRQESSNEDDARFADFEGCISVGAGKWVDYNFVSLKATKGDRQNAGIKELSGSRYLVYADISKEKFTASDNVVSFSFKEWGNRSKDYRLHIDEVYLYDKGGKVLLYLDGLGNAQYRHDPFPESPFASPAEPAVTQAPASAAAEAVTEKAEPEEKKDEPAKEEEKDTSIPLFGFDTRDSSLVTFAIIAVAFIVVFGAAIAIYAKSRKK